MGSSNTTINNEFLKKFERYDMSFHRQHTVDEHEYNQFKQRYMSWYKLSGLDLAQAFCRHFDIIDDMLELFTDSEFVEHRIYTYWIKAG